MGISSEPGVILVALAQMNPIVGDISGNSRKILDFIEEARAKKAHFIVFPEMALCGYPPEDLVFLKDFQQETRREIQKLARQVDGIFAIVGTLEVEEDLYNSAVVLGKRKILGSYRKIYLPNYGVFDEDRYFRPGKAIPYFSSGNILVGITICEDIWYSSGPLAAQAQAGCLLAFNLSASPFSCGKAQWREQMLSTRARDEGVFLAFCNMVGGQDELVFDGRSAVFGPDGKILSRAPAFSETLLFTPVDLSEVTRILASEPRKRKKSIFAPGLKLKKVSLSSTAPAGLSGDFPPPFLHPSPSDGEEIYSALVLGTRDYVRKNGFEKVIIGLSGGIDSSLVAVIAADALGKDSVIGAFFPSRFTSVQSIQDVRQLQKNLGIALLEIPIDEIYTVFLRALSEAFRNTQPGVAEENLQARIRGTLLMSLSNKFGWLVLTTGNKSELSLGYATLYGDTAGGFAVLKDIPKTLVYQLARYRNSLSPVIPESILTKPPSAELRPDQKDEDDLPAPYSVLDPILKDYVEENLSVSEIARKGFPEKLIQQIVHRVDRNEYKRRQSPIGIKITPRAFGKDRRFPITNHFLIR
ncbi:MAG: NAD+ synthase [bacterium JZ-2024 1]